MKKFVPPLTEPDRAALERTWRRGASHRERQRAQAVLLSDRGYTLEQLADILCADRDAVSRWLDAWRERGHEGLAEAPRPGRPPKIDAAVEGALRQILEQPGPNLKAAIAAELEKRGSP